jgi:oxygen-independent coproporphyrinogen-3 oxidase
MQALVAALRQQIGQSAELSEVRVLAFATLFIGGGTPSLLHADLLAEVLALCRQSFCWSAEAPEISIEVNPGTIDEQGLRALRRAGCNRLSIGIQSLDDDTLHRLGRLHSREQALVTVKAARRAGFDHLSCDLMYGLPGQTARSWRWTLEEILSHAPQHLSLYELTVEEDTPLWEQVDNGQCVLPPEEEVLAMMAITEELTGKAGYRRYEISNYALPGYQCRHNLNYWHNGFYLGLGPGAVSALAGERRSAVANLQEYCRLVNLKQPVWKEVERLEREAAFRETVVMGLRMVNGVSVNALRSRYSLDPTTYYGPTLAHLIDQEFLVLQHGRLRLSRKGLPLANQVMAQLV